MMFPSLPVLLLVLPYFTQNAAAFFPTKFREYVVGNFGTSHDTMTQAVFLQLAQKYFPADTAVFQSLYGQPLSQNMVDARNTIVTANVDVDNDQITAAKHFDGESFAAGQMRLSLLKQNVTNALSNNDGATARDALGQALHTVQDFYAHSNWVELGLAGLADLGRGTSINAAGPDQPTCKACSGLDAAAFLASIALTNGVASGLAFALGHPLAYAGSRLYLKVCYDCSGSLLANDSGLLTSGYYYGEDTKAPIDGKCHHGGPLDNVVTNLHALAGEVVGGLAWFFGGFYHPGINKDSLACDWSPHYEWHAAAVAAAEGATAQFIDDIKNDPSVTDAQFRLLFGLGTSLAFVMDTTGSMSDIQAGVAQAAEAIAQARSTTVDAVSFYVISEFNDPTVGPVYTYTNLSSFDDIMNTLPAYGGGDCPELSMEGLLGALGVVDYGAQIFLFTDAASKDFDSYSGQVVAEATAKGATINLFKFDSSCDDGLAKREDSVSNAQYGYIAAATGGSYYALPRDDVDSIEGLLDYATQPQISPILAVNTTVGDAGNNSYTFPVDGHMTFVAIDVVCAGCTVTYASPAPATNATTLDLSGQAFLVSVQSPPPGMWSVTITGPAGSSFVLAVKGNSGIHLSQFDFVASSGPTRHTGYFAIDGPPPFDTPIAVIAEMYGSVNVSGWTLRDAAADDIMALDLTPGSGVDGFPDPDTFWGVVTLPDTTGYVYVVGTDDLGQPFQRVLTAPVMPAASNTTFRVGSLDIDPTLLNETAIPLSNSTMSANSTATATTGLYSNGTMTATGSATVSATGVYSVTEVIVVTTGVCPIVSTTSVPCTDTSRCSGTNTLTASASTSWSPSTFEVTSTVTVQCCSACHAGTATVTAGPGGTTAYVSGSAGGQQKAGASVSPGSPVATKGAALVTVSASIRRTIASVGLAGLVLAVATTFVSWF